MNEEEYPDRGLVRPRAGKDQNPMRPDVQAAGSDILGLMAQGQSAVDHDPSIPAKLSSLTAENHQLRAELDQVRAERNQVLEAQRRMMELLRCRDPGKLVHDLRNVLNERDLLRALCEEQL